MPLQRTPAAWLIVSLSVLIPVTGCSGVNSATSTPVNPIPSQPSGANFIYAVDPKANVIDVFSPTAKGTAVTPINTLSVPSGIDIYSVATDNAGQIYVGVFPNQVLVYPAGSTGAATYTRSITVPDSPFHVFVDSSGSLCVQLGFDTVSVYAANAAGAASPVRTVKPTNVQLVTDVTTDQLGNLYVAGETPSGLGLVDVYSSSGVTPTRVISTVFVPTGIAVDTSGNLFVSEAQPEGAGLVEYASTADGSAAPVTTIDLAYSLTINYFSGGLRRDSAGNLFVSVNWEDLSTNPPRWTTTVYGFSPPITNASQPSFNFSTTGLASEIAVY